MSKWMQAEIAPDVHDAMLAELEEIFGPKPPGYRLCAYNSVPLVINEHLPKGAIVFRKADGTEVRSTWTAARAARGDEGQHV